MGSVLYWPALCGRGNWSNGGLFWDEQLTLNTSRPEVSPCFQATVLAWGPCAVLWLCLPVYAAYLSSCQSVNTLSQKSWLNVTKIVFSLLLAGLSLADLLHAQLDGQPTPLVLTLSPAITMATYILVAIVTHVEYKKGRHTSGVLFVYWLVNFVANLTSIVSNSIHIQDNQGQISDMFTFVTSVSTFVLIFISFNLTTFISDVKAMPRSRSRSPDVVKSEEETPLLAESEPDVPNTKKKYPSSPELKCTFLSDITHWWIFRFILQGYRRPIEFRDVYGLRSADKSQDIVPRFEMEWRKQMGKQGDNRKKSSGKVAFHNMYGASDETKLSEVRHLRRDLSDGPDSPTTPTSTSGAVGAGKKSKRGPSLTWALIKAASGPLLAGAVTRLIEAIWVFLNPILLQQVIAYIGGGDPLTWKGYVLAVVLLITNIGQTIIVQMRLKHVFVSALRVRTAVIDAVYRKALRLTSAARTNTTVGSIVNLMSIDAQKLHDVALQVHEVWVSPISVALAMYLLWQQVGASSLAGVGVICILAPFNGGIIARRFHIYQRAQMVHKDDRIKTISEILSGIKVLKMYAWEPSFSAQVQGIRKDEMRYVRFQAYLQIAIGLSFFCAPYLISLAVFAVYVLSSPDHYLSPQQAFVTINLINILNLAMANFPVVIASAAQATVSLNRVYKMLMEPEIDPDAVKKDPNAAHALTLKQASFSWGGEDDEPVLKNINLQVDVGQLSAVVGRVGCGKSSLLSAALGEMHKIKGDIVVKDSVAYVPQQAWIQNATVKDNILFGKAMDQARYDKIVKACALQQDLQILPAGDMTEIGEKGINLSGGQKQRVSLARALYQNEAVYLLDDPLSAVDAHVGKHIFEQVVGPNGLLKHKTRVLVTHGVTYLPQCEQIIVMKDGHISEIGAYAELIGHDGAFAEFIRTYLNDSDSNTEDSEDQKIKDELRRQVSTISDKGSESMHGESEMDGDVNVDKEAKPSPRHRKRSTSRSLSRRALSRDESTKSKDEMKKPQQEKNVLIAEEAVETGSVHMDVIRSFVLSAGMGYLLMFIVGGVFYIAAQAGTNIWLSMWSDDAPLDPAQGQDLAQTGMRLGVYAALGVAQVFFTGLTSAVIFLGGVKACIVMHRRLLDRILRAPMSFFDTTPAGRIVNRFSSDMDRLDSNIPMFVRWWQISLCNTVTTIVVISYSTPIFLVLVPPLGILYYIIQRVYVTTMRQAKRIDSVKRSPIYANFDETLVGVGVVRAFRRQHDFIAKNDLLLDEQQMCWYSITICQRWLGVFLESIGAFIVFFACLFAVLQRETLTGGLAGLSVSFAMQTTYAINMMVRGATELETHVVSVERIKEYSEVDTEAPWEVEGNRPPPDWPSEGAVAFHDYQTRYRPGLDLVLKGITFSVNAGEKVGIVGRTGAGKSSMALSLFRLIEASGGKIVIDGVDVSKIGLHDLRNQLTIIPQDPVLFCGTLRKNLDPFDRFSDAEVWASLEHAHLKAFVGGLAEGLQYACGEGGSALSVGQRQLVCLARALLKKCKILVLDEATAAVDLETDDLIQATIRAEFKPCTVLTIAHRINTILDYDRVMVLDEGKIKEFDHPTSLLQDRSSDFHSMARDAGLV